MFSFLDDTIVVLRIESKRDIPLVRRKTIEHKIKPKNH